MPETLAQREEGVRHVLLEHYDHRALIRYLAKKFSTTEERVREEVIAEVKNIPALER